LRRSCVPSSSAPIRREYPATSAARIAVRRRTGDISRPAVNRLYAALGHIAVQYFEPLLALAAADDLADPGANTSIAATVRPSSFTRM
jgi:hypothetical protein